MKEEWKTISTHPEYEVSNTGHVRNKVWGTFLKGNCKKNQQYLGPYVRLYHGKAYTIAYLVYVHFIGPRPRCFSIRLKDSKKLPSIHNLKLHKTVAQHWSQPGYNPSVALLPGYIKLIKHLHVADKLTVHQIASTLGISTTTVYYHLKKEGVKFKKYGKSYA